MVFQHGIYHTDPHPGNFLLAPGVITILDFGDVARISRSKREQLEDLIAAVGGGDPRARPPRRCSRSRPRRRTCSPEDLQDDVESMITDHLAGGVGSIDLTAVSRGLVAVVRRHGLSLPADIALVLRVVTLLQGLAADIGADIDLQAITRPFALDLARRRLDPRQSLGRALRTGRSWERLVETLPGEVTALLQQIRREGGADLRSRTRTGSPTASSTASSRRRSCCRPGSWSPAGRRRGSGRSPCPASPSREPPGCATARSRPAGRGRRRPSPASGSPNGSSAPPAAPRRNDARPAAGSAEAFPVPFLGPLRRPRRRGAAVSTTGTDTGRERRRVDPEIARSWLLVNGNRPEVFDASRASRADQVVLDVEDAVDPAKKDAARADVIAWLGAGNHAWVRINDRSTPFWADDVALLAGLEGLDGVMLAKTEAAEHVTETFDRLGGAVPVLALIESAVGIEAAVSIAARPRRVPARVRQRRLPPRHRHERRRPRDGVPALPPRRRQPRRQPARPDRRPDGRLQPPRAPRAVPDDGRAGHDRASSASTSGSCR